MRNSVNSSWLVGARKLLLGALATGVFLVAYTLLDSPPPAAAAPTVKVDVCHIPPGNPANFHTIRISENALSAHLAHGDAVGACNAVCAFLCDDDDECTIDDYGDCETNGCPTGQRDPTPCFIDDCRDDDCIPATGCVNDPLEGAPCDDGMACTDDVCDASGACVGTPVTDCCVFPDLDGTQCGSTFCNGRVCTMDDVCVDHPPCGEEDGLSCTEPFCNEGAQTCEAAPVDARCDDEIDCTVDSCNPATVPCFSASQHSPPDPLDLDPIQTCIDDCEARAGCPPGICGLKGDQAFETTVLACFSGDDDQCEAIDQFGISQMCTNVVGVLPACPPSGETTGCDNVPVNALCPLGDACHPLVGCDPDADPGSGCVYGDVAGCCLVDTECPPDFVCGAQNTCEPTVVSCTCWAQAAAALGYQNVSTLEELWAAGRPTGGCGYIDSCEEFSSNSPAGGSYRSSAGCYTSSSDGFETKVAYSNFFERPRYGCTYSRLNNSGFIDLETTSTFAEFEACLVEHDAFTTPTGPLPSPPEQIPPVTELDSTATISNDNPCLL